MRAERARRLPRTADLLDGPAVAQHQRLPVTRARLGSKARWFLLASTLSTRALAAETVVTLEGDVPAAGPDHFFVPFTSRRARWRSRYATTTSRKPTSSIGGSTDPNGFRGWGGGNSEPAVVGIGAASRSYVAGPIAPGEWRVVVGKAKIVEPPARYQIEVELRDAPTLAAQPERAPVRRTPRRSDTERRWYAGDFHVHSRESGDARPTIDEIATFARGRGLDFVMLSDHNTSDAARLSRRRARPPPASSCFVPGIEFTTYAGHANAIGATRWVDHKIGQPGVTHRGGARRRSASRARSYPINHPVLDLGDLCIGCAWKHDSDPEQDRRRRDRDRRAGTRRDRSSAKRRSNSGMRSAHKGVTSPRSAAATTTAPASTSEPSTARS